MIAGVFRFVLEGLEISVHLTDAPSDTPACKPVEPHGRTQIEGIQIEFSLLAVDHATEYPQGILRFRNPSEVPGILTIDKRFEIEVTPRHTAIVTARAESKARLES